MGNKPIKLGITLNKATYEAGNDLTGIVYHSLSGDNDLQLASTARVYLIFKGREYTRIEGDTIDTIVDCLVNLKVSLKTFPSGRFQPGQFEFPFSGHFHHTFPAQLISKMCQINLILTYNTSKLPA
jgi:hypothetical protein